LVGARRSYGALGSVLNKDSLLAGIVIQAFQRREAWMVKQVYWLSDAEWRRIEPLLPRGRRGAHRVEDRRVISGIVHMLRCGARWRDCPEVYGPYTTIYNRFNRWSRQGIWTDIFYALTGSTGMYGAASVDSTYIKAHRSAAGAKGGPSTTPSAARAADKRPRSMR
jgi:transposase